MTHQPIAETWKLVYKSDDVLVLSAACTCGNDDRCSYTLTTYLPSGQSSLINVVN